MSIDSSKLSIISVAKVDGRQLSRGGGSIDPTAAAALPDAVLAPRRQKCRLCCILYGTVISAFGAALFSTVMTCVAISGRKYGFYTVQGAARQIVWLSMPGCLVGTTLHYFLVEAMWSGRHNSWGQAWMKALVCNSLMWGGVVGAGTLLWRRLLPCTAAGRRLYHRFPISGAALDLRILRSEREWLTGMGWSYWLLGVGSGQIGFVTTVTICALAERPYFFMPHDGGYARRCMPPWRIEQLARMSKLPDARAKELSVETSPVAAHPEHAVKG